MNDEAIHNALASVRRTEERALAVAAVPSQEEDLPDWLEHGLARAGAHATIVAQRAYKLHAVGIDLPVLMLPLAGMKRVELGSAQASVEPGEFLMIHQVTSLQVENIPPAHGAQPYRAWALAFPWRIVELARSLLSAHVQAAVEDNWLQPFSSGLVAPLLPALKQLLDLFAASEEPDAALLDHALLGVMIALARNGHAQFLRASDPSLGARIRLLAAAAPERDWTSADFEEALHISGATLRRRLAEENTSLRELLRDARLHHGLVLLQTGSKPLKSIALACGYRSVPSFTRNFIERFGIEPSAVAGR